MHRNVYLLYSLFFAIGAFAQSSEPQVGMGTSTPHSSAFLEIRSANKGFLMHRMTEASIRRIPFPATGLMVFQTDGVVGYRYYDGIGWKTLGNIYLTPPHVNSIPNNSITNRHFKRNALASFNLEPDAIGTDQFGSGAITGEKVIQDELTTEKIANNALQVSNLQPPPAGTTNGSLLIWDAIATKWKTLKLPTGNLSYIGSWDAGGNSPDINGRGHTTGEFYIVRFKGSRKINTALSGVVEDFQVGDWVVYDDAFPAGFEMAKSAGE